MYTHIIWDFDGTLFDTYPAMSSAFSNILKTERRAHEDEYEIRALMKVSLSRAYRAYTEKYALDDIFFEKYNNLRFEYELMGSKPYDGAFDLCRLICERGRHNYLFTHRDLSAVTLLEKFGMHIYFTDFITHASGFESKPSPQAIVRLAEKHKFPRKSAIMAGDREIDALSAKNAGISSVLITENLTIKTCADYVIADCREMYAILNLNGDDK